jgi:hypothetical protein
MFQKIIDALARLSRERVPFDPAVLNDPAALATQWTPLAKGGANFRTHALVVKAAQRIEFLPSIMGYVFGIIFTAIGLGIAVFAALQLARRPFNPGLLSLLMPLLFGAVFAGIGIGILRVFTTPVIFDTGMGYFWKGRIKPEELFLNTPEALRDKIVPLQNVRALQILAEHCRGNKSSYYSYELNLVLHNGSRVNVVDHGDLAKLRADAQQLSALTGKPVWDATADHPVKSN